MELPKIPTHSIHLIDGSTIRIDDKELRRILSSIGAKEKWSSFTDIDGIEIIINLSRISYIEAIIKEVEIP